MKRKGRQLLAAFSIFVLMSLPEEFQCTGTGKPFQDCMICSDPLIESGKPYLIEKAVRHHREFGVDDIVFEYALCIECALEMQEKISPESREQIDNYFRGSKLDPTREENEFEPAEPRDTKSCAVTGKNKSDCDHYQIFAFCQGNSLLQGQPPYMLSGDILMELQELLSEKTRDEFHDFTETYLGPSPEFEDLFRPKTVPFL